MDWSFTEEQEQVAALARHILDGELDEERMRAIESGESGARRFDERLHQHLTEAGVLSGLPLIELCRVLVEVGRAVAPVPAVPVALASLTLDRFGSSGQPVPGSIDVPALVEELNPDLTLPTTRADRDGDAWRLNGAKTTVTGGAVADRFLVSADAGAEAVLAIVGRDDAGVTVTAQRTTNSDVEALVELDGVNVPDDRIVRGPGLLGWVLRHHTVLVCAHQLGVCERALELTAGYSKQRVQFDRPIATFQAVGQRLADAYIDVQAIRLTLWQAAWRLSEGLDCDEEIATAKFWAADAGHRVAHAAVHVHGGMGIDLDYHLHRYFTAAKRNEFALGGATEHLAALGRRLANEPA